jgi:hypothetical protein
MELTRRGLARARDSSGSSARVHSVYLERPGESNLTLETFLRESLF